jgi:hypothetical protein
MAAPPTIGLLPDIEFWAKADETAIANDATASSSMANVFFISSSSSFSYLGFG